MKTDNVLLKRKTKATPKIIKEIHKFRNKGLSYTQLAKKFGLSRSYVYYLCLEGEKLTDYRNRMAVYSKGYYFDNRERIIENSKLTQKKNREKKAEILKKASKKRCFIGRSRNL